MPALKIIFELFVLTIPVAIVAFVYSYMLTRPGMIFEKLYYFLEQKTPEYVHYPTIYCERCVAGQFGLWIGLFVVFPSIHLHYNFFLHVFYIASCIFNVALVKSLYIIITGEEKETVREEKRAEDPPEVKQLR